MNLESLIDFIKKSSLDEDVKEVLTDRLQAEGLTMDVVDVLKEAFQDKIEELFDAAGVKIDPKDPEAVKEYQAYQDALAQIEKDGESEMAGLQAEMSQQVAKVQTSADDARANQIRHDLP
ncbi:hypothetical protein KBD34_00640 [Patescibacteria group bacterium]|nr:hypothetical protein [Patescibacteria group bacterium]